MIRKRSLPQGTRTRFDLHRLIPRSRNNTCLRTVQRQRLCPSMPRQIAAIDKELLGYREQLRKLPSSAQSGVKARAMQVCSRRCGCSSSSVRERLLLRDGGLTMSSASLRPPGNEAQENVRATARTDLANAV